MQQGQTEAKIRELAKKTGQRLPDKILNKPHLLIGLDFYWRAFWECASDRIIGMAEGPIPWSSIDRWALRYEVEGEDFERLVFLIKAMDEVYIEHRTKSHKKKMDKAMKSKGGGKTPIKGPIRNTTDRRPS